MAIPRTKKQKKGTFTHKELYERCETTGHTVQLVMCAAIQGVLKVDADQLIRVLESAARYSKYYDDNLIVLKDVSDSIYKQSNGEIDLRTIEMRMRCQNRI